MLKEFLMKKMLKSQLKDVPEHEQEKMLKLISENPELFQKIGLEIQAKIKTGKDQMSASLEVMQNYKEELQKLSLNK
jgi:2-oxo-4-hydroxy-4-carboxy--5-ureidoimidazoline (OHCU) decarboxylase